MTQTNSLAVITDLMTKLAVQGTWFYVHSRSAVELVASCTCARNSCANPACTILPAILLLVSHDRRASDPRRGADSPIAVE